MRNCSRSANSLSVRPTKIDLLFLRDFLKNECERGGGAKLCFWPKASVKCLLFTVSMLGKCKMFTVNSLSVRLV